MFSTLTHLPMQTRLPAPAERRATPRYRLTAAVYVRHAHTDYVLELADISLTGAYVRLGSTPWPKWVRTGSSLELRVLSTSGPELVPVSVRGRIARTSADGFGFVFDRLDAATVVGVSKLLEMAIAAMVATPES